jgi:hypothetical protein
VKRNIPRTSCWVLVLNGLLFDKRHAPPKHRDMAKQHGVTSQNATLFRVSAMRTSDPTNGSSVSFEDFFKRLHINGRADFAVLHCLANLDRTLLSWFS